MANLPQQYADSTNSLLDRGAANGYGFTDSTVGPPPFLVNQQLMAAHQAQANAQAYAQSYAQAKQANEQRYQDILGSNSQNPLLSAINAGDPTVLAALQAGKTKVTYNGKSYQLPKIPFREVKVDGKIQKQSFVGGMWKDSSQIGPQDFAQSAAASLQNPSAPLLGGYQGIYNRANQNVAQQTSQQNQLNSAYGARTNQLMGYVDQAGKQERIDTNNRYNNLQSAEHSNLVNRGLTASTVADSVAGQVEAQRTQALGELNDRQAMLHVNTYGSASGQQLAAQGEGNRYLGQLGYQTQTQIPEQMLQFAQARNDIYPNLQQFNQVQGNLGTMAAAAGAAQQRWGQPSGMYGAYG